MDDKERNDETKPLVEKQRNQQSFGGEVVGRKPSRLITVEPVIILGFYGISAFIPLLEQYAYGKLAAKANVSITTTEGESDCSVNRSDPLSGERQKVQAQTTDFFNVVSTLMILPNVLLAPVFMYLSDIYGRRPMLAVNLIFMLASYLEWTLCVQYDLPLAFLYVGAGIFGFFGSGTFLSLCLAYLADSTGHSDRSLKMLIFEVSSAIACILSNLVTGFLIKYVDVMYPFSSFAVCTFIALVYVFFLHEPLDRSVRSRHSLQKFVAPFKGAFVVYFKDNGSKRRWKIQLLSFVMAIITANHAALLVILPLYLLNSPVCFDSVAIGIVVVEIYFFRALGTLTISKCLKRMFSDTSVIMLSLLSDIIMIAIFGFLPNPTWIFFAPFPGMAGLLSLGYIKSVASKLLQADEQGAYFAGYSIMVSISITSVVLVSNLIYTATLNFYSGSVFIFLAVVTFIMFCCILVLHVAEKRDSRTETTIYSAGSDNPLQLSTERAVKT